MTVSGVKVVGLASAQKAIREAGDADGVIKKSNIQAANTVLTLAKTPGFAPVRTGKLWRSLRVSKSSTTASVLGGGARVPYANPIHWGWFVDKNTGMKKNIMPNPFLYRAFDRRREEVVTTYFDNMEAQLQKIAAKQRATVR